MTSWKKVILSKNIGPYFFYTSLPVRTKKCIGRIYYCLRQPDILSPSPRIVFFNGPLVLTPNRNRGLLNKSMSQRDSGRLSEFVHFRSVRVGSIQASTVIYINFNRHNDVPRNVWSYPLQDEKRDLKSRKIILFCFVCRVCFLTKKMVAASPRSRNMLPHARPLAIFVARQTTSIATPVICLASSS